MPYRRTTATEKVLKLRNRIRAVAGGTSGSKTISILMVLIDMAMVSKEPKIISIVSESIPHLKRGAMRDFQDIMMQHGYWNDSCWNRTDLIYTFKENGVRIEFFGADQPDKARGPRRHVLFINEANNVPFETYNQLEVRTKETIFLDWNPTNEFWFYTDILTNPDLEEKIDFITLTYKDNEALEPDIVQSIESRKHNKNWWQVFGLGQLGNSEGKVYTGWQIIDEIPHEARLERYGLDFGYTNDPTAIIAIYAYNGGYILDEVAYQRGMSNKAIADLFSNLEKALVVADSAEPKSIDEIASHGISVIGATKGQGSVSQGIDYVQQQRISLTSKSPNLIKAYRNYMFVVDRDGRTINEPDDSNHEWSNTMDAVRYGFDALRPRPTERKRFHGYQSGNELGFGRRAVYR